MFKHSYSLFYTISSLPYFSTLSSYFVTENTSKTMSPASTGVLFLLVAIAVVPFVNGDLTCRDENGDPVDWFIMYKMPRLKHHPEPLVREGIGYFYMDANRPEFVLSTKNLTHKNHALFYTLAPVYDSATDSTMGQNQVILRHQKFTFPRARE